jgi:hypothetical protein
LADDGSVRINVEAVLTKDDVEKLASQFGVLDKAAEKSKGTLSSVQTVLQGFGQGIGQQAFDVITGGIKAIAAAAPAMVDKLLEAADTFSNISAQTAINTEALQGFAVAGAAVGVTADEIGGGLARMQRAMAEGSTSTQAALQAIGLSAQQLKGIAPEKQLQMILTELQKMPDPSQRTAAAMELLGRGGVALVPLGENLAKVTERAQALGIVMSDRVVRAADAMGDRIGLLGQTWEGLQRNLVSVIATSAPLQALLDGITDILGEVSRSVQLNSDSWQSFVDGAVFAVVDGMFLVLDVVDAVSDAWIMVSSVVAMAADIVLVGLGAISDVISAVTFGFVDFRTAAENVGTIFDALKLTWTALKFTVTELALAVTHAANAFAIMTGNDALTVSTQANITALQGFQVELSNTANDIVEGVTAKETDARVTDGLRGKLEALRDKVRGAGQAHQEAAAGAGKQGASLADLKKQTEAAVKAHEKMVEALKKVASETKGFQTQLAAMTGGITPLQKKFDEIDQKAGELEATMRAGAKSKAELDAAMGKVGAWTNLQKEIAKVEERQRLFGKSAREAQAEADYLTDQLVEQASVSQFTAEQLQSILDKYEALAAAGANVGGEIAEVTDQLNKQGSMSTQQQKKFDAAADARKDQLEREAQAMEDFQEKLGNALSHFGELADVLLSVGVAGDNAFVQILTSMEKASAAGAAFRDAWKNKDWVGAAVAGVGAVVSTFQAATQGGTKGERVMGGALAGGTAGAQIGSTFGPMGAVIGGGIGAGLGAITGLVSGDPGWKKAADFVGRQFGAQITKETGQAIQDLQKKLKLPRETASLLMLGQVATDSKKDMREFASGTQDLMNAIAMGVVPAEQGLAAVNEQWIRMRTEAQAAGRVADRATMDVLKRARELGQVTPEMTAAVNDSLGMAAQGMTKFTKMFDAMDPSMLEGDFARMGGNAATIFMATFGAITKEQGIVAAVSQLGDSFGPLRDKLAIVGDEAALAILGPFESIHSAVTDETLGPMIEAADGLRQIMVGLADAGYMDVNAFTAMQQTSQDMFSQMVAGGMPAEQAVAVLAPNIQAAVSAAEQMNVPLDESTLALKKIAEDAGIAFQVDPMLRAADAMERVADSLERVLGGANGSADAFDRMAQNAARVPAVGGGGGGNTSGGGVRPPVMAASGAVIEPRPGGTPAIVGEGGSTELIAPVAALAREIGRGLAGSSGGTGETNVTIAPVFNLQVAGDPRTLGLALGQMLNDGVLPEFEAAIARRLGLAPI